MGWADKLLQGSSLVGLFLTRVTALAKMADGISPKSLSAVLFAAGLPLVTFDSGEL